MKNNNFHRLFLALVLTLLLVRANAQSNDNANTIAGNTNITTPVVSKNITRPADSLGISEIDNYVNQCYNTYDKSNQFSVQVDAIQQHVLNQNLSDVDTRDINDQLKALKGQVNNLKLTGDVLVEAGAEMNKKVLKDLKFKPFKLPGAVLRVHNANDAVKASLKTLSDVLKKQSDIAKSLPEIAKAKVENLKTESGIKKKSRSKKATDDNSK